MHHSMSPHKDSDASKMYRLRTVALYELSMKAGVSMDNMVFRSVHALISLGCSPAAVYSMLKHFASLHAKKLATQGDPNSTITAHNSTAAVAAASAASIQHPNDTTTGELQTFLLDKSRFIDTLLAPSRNLDSQSTVLSSSSTSNHNITNNNNDTHISNYDQTNKAVTTKPRMLPSYTLKHN
ncbi:unnamed protein product [Trichobilharzia szidati]|nr:unnamed protein product [Trichobilharzia szidati]